MGLAKRSFRDFGQLRDRLTAVLVGLSAVFESLDHPDRAADMQSESTRVADRCFRVVVMGAMKRGKSTLINAMLGAEALPMQATVACTAIPISVRYGTESMAVCHKRSGDAPLTFDWVGEPEKLREAVTIPEKFSKDAEENMAIALSLHPFTHAEITAPLSFLKEGVELCDSPGLNEDTRRSDATWALAKSSDAVILVLDIDCADLESDREDIARIIREGHDPRVLFVVWNQVDVFDQEAPEQVRRKPAEYERAKREAFGVTDRESVPRDHVLFTSAQWALWGRTRKKQKFVDSSGIPLLEREMGEFLMHEKGTAKLLGPLNIAEHAVREAMASVSRQDPWSGPVKDVQALADKGREALEQADGALAQFLARAKRTSDRLVRSVRTSVKSFAEDVHGEIPEVVARVDVGLREAIFDHKLVAARFTNTTESWITTRFAEWERKSLRSLIEESRTEVNEYLEELLTAVRGSASRIADASSRASRSSDLRSERAHEQAGTPISSTDLVEVTDQANGVSWDIGADLSAQSGATGGAIIGGVAGLWLAAFLALPLLPVIIVAALAGVVVGGSSAIDKLKRRAASHIQDALEEQTPELEKQLAKSVGKSSSRAADSIERKLNGWIDSLRKAVRAIEERAQEEKRLANERQELLGQLRRQLETHSVELSALRREIDTEPGADRLAERISTRIGTTGPASATTLPESELELKHKLHEPAFERWKACGDYFLAKGRWDPVKHDAFIELCTRSLVCLKPSATKQLPALWAVAAKTFSEGSESLPTPTELSSRLGANDPTYMMEIVDVYGLLTGDSSGRQLQDSPNPSTGLIRAGSGVSRFVTSYRRALERIQLRSNTDEPGGRSVIHGVKDREPYRAPE